MKLLFYLVVFLSLASIQSSCQKARMKAFMDGPDVTDYVPLCVKSRKPPTIEPSDRDDPRGIEVEAQQLRTDDTDKYELFQSKEEYIFCVDQDTGEPISKLFELVTQMDIRTHSFGRIKDKMLLCKKYKL